MLIVHTPPGMVRTISGEITGRIVKKVKARLIEPAVETGRGTEEPMQIIPAPAALRI